MSDLKATLHMTPHAKRIVAQTMYHRGHDFVRAALLLREKGGYEFVVLHLICQGMELVLKSLLLYRDYDRYSVLIKKKIGHDLKRAADTVIAEFQVKSLPSNVDEELQSLSNLYKNHLLRYATGYDHFVDPKTIRSDLVLGKLAVVVKLADRSLPWFV
jgi:hypothetical protein